MSSTEEWRPIENYEGLYEVSTLGNIRSLRRLTRGRWSAMKTSPSRQLKGRLTNAGYLRVDLCKQGLKTHNSIHRIVAEAFIPNPKNKRCVNHKDSNRTNNRVENLEWCTYKENIQHAIINRRLTVGSNNVFAKLDEAKVLDIRKRIDTEFGTVLAREYGVSNYAIWAIKHNVSWRHVELRKKVKAMTPTAPPHGCQDGDG